MALTPIVTNTYNILVYLYERLAFDRHGIARIWCFGGIFKESPKGQAPKCVAKINTIECINKWVHGRIEPSQPSQQCRECSANCFRRQEWRYQISDEEWKPTQKKWKYDNAQCLRCLILAFERQYSIGQWFVMCGAASMLFTRHTMLVHDHTARLFHAALMHAFRPMFTGWRIVRFAATATATAAAAATAFLWNWHLFVRCID